MRNFNKPEKLTDKDKALLRYVDNVKNDDPATMQMIRDYNPYEKKNKQSPDVYEISEELNKFRAKNDQLPTYNSNEPKEKMEMRKNYKSYDFTKRKFKADIVKEEILKTPITKPAPAPLKPVEVPRIDVGELIKRRADDRAAREKANIIREFGDKGLGLLRLKFEGLDD